MHWFERKIRRYEHRRWTTDDNRRVQPFDWGLEHIGGSPADPNPGDYVRQYAKRAIENSEDWFATSPATDYHLDNENVLTFTSSIESRLAGKQHRPRTTFPGQNLRKLERPAQSIASRIGATELERQMARPARLMRMAATHRHYRAKNEHALPRPAHGEGP